MSRRELHWRPPTYWQAHTDVNVDANFDRLDLGDGVWGAGHRSSHFVVGDAHVSIADVQTHTFTVTSNGRVQRVIPMSAGRDAYPTKNGVHIMGLLRDLNRQEGVTMVMVTHNLDLIADGDRVVRLQDGRVEAALDCIGEPGALAPGSRT